MNYENINLNEIIISGNINNIKKLSKNIAFGLTCNNYSSNKSKCYISFQIYEDLYNSYKDLFIKGNNVFVKGYLNSYTDKDNRIVAYVRVMEMSDNPDDIVNGRKGPYFRVDPDGVEVWNGQRCEAVRLDDNDPKRLEIEGIIREFE